MVEDKDVYSLMESLTPINFNSAEAFLLYSAIDFFYNHLAKSPSLSNLPCIWYSSPKIFKMQIVVFNLWLKFSRNLYS